MRRVPAALETPDRLPAMTESDQSRHASARYNIACILALANRKAEAITTIRAVVAAGLTDCQRCMEDTDFERLCNDPEFKSIMSDLRKRHSPQRLEWDRGGNAPDFRHRFSDPEMAKLIPMRGECAISEAVAAPRVIMIDCADWPHGPADSGSTTRPRAHPAAIPSLFRAKQEPADDSSVWIAQSFWPRPRAHTGWPPEFSV